MAASDPNGGQKFWFNGVPFRSVAEAGVDTGGVKYWFNGTPVDAIIPVTRKTFVAFSTPQLDGQVITHMIGY